VSYSLRTAAEIAPAASERYGRHAEGYARDELVGQHVGSVHTGFALCALDPGGHVDAHLHSCEESFFILAGNPTLVLDGRAHRLAPEECGLVPLGATHSWQLDDGEAPARWLEMTAPAPRLSGPPDTFFTGDGAPAEDARPLDIRDPRTRTFFRLDPGQMELDNRKLGAPVDAPTVSASMATALLAYSGITLQMLVDERLGAVLHTMFMVQYEPGGVAQPHDHPLEETYYLLEGEVEALADGETIVLRAGDVFWTSVGCVHAFYNRSTSERVRWLETQSPQPPRNHSYRFDRDWDYLATRLPDGGR
jgi:quercetin dioxygenase-like cupin family protein